MAELQTRLQGAVGDTYRIEKELGGGGMSRVFLAEEVDLGRRVVIKVLPPEMAADVSQERFHREIQLAANLQHPHIVSLLTAGAQDDPLYYVMPYIKGESLRAKLAREGELPVGEAVRILKEVIDALAYAHREGVVHRDINPDNVLHSEGHAVVTDFGVAKAVTASSGSSSLTSLGVALGTPAYMAPEQAAADPHTDHRADIYAVGTLSYEMLCGEPPFTGPTPQAVMAAHMSDAAEPISNRRSAVSDVLNSLIMRCLEKRAADRWQKAEELLPHLDAILTPTGGITPTGTAPLPAVDYEAAARQAHPVRVAAMFGAGSALVLGLVYVIMIQLGLPDWVFLGAIALLAIGLPIILVTGHHERRRALERTTGAVLTTPPGGLRRWFTWRKSLISGGLAFAGLGVAVSIYAAMRVMGIGPAGTLITTGVLEERDQLIVADFENATSDSTLSETVTELLRIDLSQSPMIVVLDRAQVAEILQHMQQSRQALVTFDLARQAAIREGMKAFITGEIRSVGSGYVITARLTASSSGATLASAAETAPTADDIVDAVDGLSAKLRERIGESLRTVRADPPLERLTTSSLEALRLYTQATRIANEGDQTGAVALLEEAVAKDSTFAMAYRRLGAYLGNPGTRRRARGDSMLTRAYELRDQLSDRERYHVEALYAARVEGDYEQSVTSYLALLEKHPNDATALNNIAVTYGFNLGRWTEAEQMARRGVATGLAPSLTYAQLVSTPVFQGNFVRADSALRLFDERFPDHPDMFQAAYQLAASQWNYELAVEHLNQLRETQTGNAQWQSFTASRLSRIAEARGQLREAQRWRVENLRANAVRFDWSREEREFQEEWNQMVRAVWFGTGPPVTESTINAVWQRHIALHDSPLSRDYVGFAVMLARIGSPVRARQLMEELRALLPEETRSEREDEFDEMEAEISLAEDRPLDAVVRFRALQEGAPPWTGRSVASRDRIRPQSCAEPRLSDHVLRTVPEHSGHVSLALGPVPVRAHASSPGRAV